MAFGSTLSVQEDSVAARKERGAFFTPSALVKFICDWAIRKSDDTVLEPACGEAEFLLGAAARLHGLGASVEEIEQRLHGCELHEASASAACRRLSSEGYACRMETGDFLRMEPDHVYDAVIGNPPYVRFQVLKGAQRDRAKAAASRNGVSLSSLASLWAPFVMHATSFLKDGGRLGLVLPAELLTVNYAAPIRSYLLSEFASIHLATFDQRVFPEVQEEVVVLLADGFHLGSSSSIAWHQCMNLEDLHSADIRNFSPTSKTSRWSEMFAPSGSSDILDRLCDESFGQLESWGSISLGAVTGGNSFFALSQETMDRHHLDAKDTVPISPPGSKHLRMLDFSDADFARMTSGGKRTRLFYPAAGRLSDAAEAYIAYGESLGISDAYKCRKRNPWWRVPLTKKPDLFITYMNAAGPNLCANGAGVYNLNSCHGLVLDDACKAWGKAYLPLACLNSATLMSAEIVGRPYGGGILKLEPREAAVLAVPSPATVARAASALDSVRETVLLSLQHSDRDSAVALVDRILLRDELGYREDEIGLVHKAYMDMRARREQRGEGAKGRPNG